jgi:hypothetical protein
LRELTQEAKDYFVPLFGNLKLLKYHRVRNGNYCLGGDDGGAVGGVELGEDGFGGGDEGL